MLPILMYHALWPGTDDAGALEALWHKDPQLREPGARRYALDARVFARHLQVFKQARLDTLATWPEAAAITTRQILLTFDDGHVSNHTLALPLLRQTGACAAFFITTDWINTPGFMDENQLRDLHNSGMLLGTHGTTHRYFSDLSEAELRRELHDSKQRLESILGARIPALALPGGSNHPRIGEAARDCGYQYVFTSRMAAMQGDDDQYDLPRIAILNTQPPRLVEEIATGDLHRVKAMAKAAERRRKIRKVLGNKFYDIIRGLLVRG